jgi:hypothetical protein
LSQEKLTHSSESQKFNLFVLALLVVFSLSLTVQAQVPLKKISADAFTNTDSEHKTEVEADTLSNGNTIVTTFQQGRFNTGGGCSDIGWATSLDGGVTWQHGSLPGITTIEGSGPFDRVSDPAVAFDAMHGVWMIATLPILNSGGPHTSILISRSLDGINWDNPVSVTPKVENSDKTWVSCDNNSSSPFFGHCYAAWDDNLAGDVIFMNTSTDGGLTWAAAKQPAGAPTGLGENPLAAPNGVVVAPGSDAFSSSIQAFTSKNGGTSWTGIVTITTTTTHAIAGGLRDLNLPTSAMDAKGKTYVVFHDCRFRTGCSSNDIVMSTSANGKTWSAVARIPIDAVNSTADHFIPGIEVQPGTSGATAHLGVSYYFYPVANCTLTTCQLVEGFISSPDGGQTWTAPTTVSKPIKLSWLPATSLGQMVGDYQSVSYVGTKAFPGVVGASANAGTVFNESLFAPSAGLTEGLALYNSDNDKPVPNAHSDHPRLVVPQKAP